MVLHPGEGRGIQLDDDDRGLPAEEALDDRAPDPAAAAGDDVGAQRAGS
jgi:hypothetical protein